MPDPSKNYKMKQGSKEIDTPGTFRREAQPNLDSISRARTSRIEKMVSDRINNPPSYTDSLAVYTRNSGTGAKVYNPIANAAEKKYGKIDVSGFKPSIDKKPDLASARKKYGL
jgi:hypothetical protein